MSLASDLEADQTQFLRVSERLFIYALSLGKYGAGVLPRYANEQLLFDLISEWF
jgi:hypothetical protein